MALPKWTVNTGNNAFRRTLPFFVPKLYVAKLVKAIRIDMEFLRESAYKMFNPDGSLDKDTYDFSKSFVVSFHLTENTYSSFMLGWNYSPTTGKHKCVVYTHTEEIIYMSEIEGEGVPSFSTGDKATLIAEHTEGTRWTLHLFKNDQPLIINIPFEANQNTYIRVAPPWFGGANNASGEFGGKAPHKVTVGMDIKAICSYQWKNSEERALLENLVRGRSITTASFSERALEAKKKAPTSTLPMPFYFITTASTQALEGKVFVLDVQADIVFSGTDAQYSQKAQEIKRSLNQGFFDRLLVGTTEKGVANLPTPTSNLSDVAGSLAEYIKHVFGLEVSYVQLKSTHINPIVGVWRSQ